MARRLLESLRGVGDVYAGDVLLRKTTYDVSVWLEDHREPSNDDGKTVTIIDGRIDISSFGEAIVLAGPGTLMLALDDGRRLAFQLTGTAGGIVGKGWLP